MKHPIHSTPAHLWDGKRQFPGRLEIWEYKLEFRFEEFPKSHMNLVIPIWEILKVEEFLLFDISRNGIRVENQKGKTDAFVLEKPGIFRKRILSQIEKVSQTD